MGFDPGLVTQWLDMADKFGSKGYIQGLGGLKGSVSHQCHNEMDCVG